MSKAVKVLSLFVALLLSYGVLAVLDASDAQASRYDLVDVELVAPEAQSKIIESGITDTMALLEAVVTAEGRAELATLTGLPEEDVNRLARTLEFMQIKGIGPKAALLLLESGVGSVEVLAKMHPNELLEKVTETNLTQQITGVDPDMAVVEDWIDKAANASIVLQ